MAEDDDVEVWEVRDRAGRTLLRFSDEPGPIVSARGWVAGATPPLHPFLTAVFLEAEEEYHLRELLGPMTKPGDFVTRLRAEGYTLVRPPMGGAGAPV